MKIHYILHSFQEALQYSSCLPLLSQVSFHLSQPLFQDCQLIYGLYLLLLCISKASVPEPEKAYNRYLLNR